MIVHAVDELGIQIRAGVHTGECERTGDNLVGLAVHIGARVGAAAGPGEVWVSRTVRDLVAGSGVELLHEASEMHHVVFRIADGAEDDWASF